MKLFAVIEGEYHEASHLKGIFSTRDKALIQVEETKKAYFIHDASWTKREYDEWYHGIDYIKIDEFELDEYYEEPILGAG